MFLSYYKDIIEYKLEEYVNLIYLIYMLIYKIIDEDIR